MTHCNVKSDTSSRIDAVETEETCKDEKVRIRFAVFFDGTLNNEKNINARLLSTPEHKLNADEVKIAQELKRKVSDKDKRLAAAIAYKKYGAKDPDEENSYEGFYTNVVRMEKTLDIKSPDKNKEIFLKTYIEGAGTIDKKTFEGDKTMGYAFALCESGVRKKVKKGIKDVFKQITDNVKKDIIIDSITFDVFGFSRGAAEARNFIYEALDGKKNISAQLKKKGYTVNSVNVEFAGLYDTVSTYGLWVMFGAADNVEELHLDAVKSAKQVVQLASADEHREYFSLTNINSSANGYEIFLPGVHSDIGGGYRDKANEDNAGDKYKTGMEIIWSFRKDYAERDCAELIESGYYKKDQLTLEATLGDDGEEQEYSVYANRKGIRNGYSNIPLHIMADFARKNTVKILTTLEDNNAIPGDLSEADKEIKSYILKMGKKKSKHTDWTPESNDWNIKKAWVQKLRNQYCHFSAKYKMGHTPRVSMWDGTRSRKIYHG